MTQAKGPGMLDGIAMIVMTVPRQVPYVHQALASIFSSGREVYDAAPLHVVVDSCDTTYLAEYAGHPAIRLHYLTEAEASAQGRRGLCSRFCSAYCRCLAIPAKAGVAVLEDDVIVRDGFLRCLAETILEMENGAGLSDYILSLHAKRNLRAHPAFQRGHFYISSPARRFYGTQGMYYPASVARELREYIHQHGVAAYRRPGDLLIAEYAHAHRNLYNTVWDLVEHTGSVSTGLGAGRAFNSATFHEPWRPFVRPARRAAGPRRG
jgi:hypothetical protein